MNIISPENLSVKYDPDEKSVTISVFTETEKIITLENIEKESLTEGVILDALANYDMAVEFDRGNSLPITYEKSLNEINYELYASWSSAEVRIILTKIPENDIAEKKYAREMDGHGSYDRNSGYEQFCFDTLKHALTAEKNGRLKFSPLSVEYKGDYTNDEIAEICNITQDLFNKGKLNEQITQNDVDKFCFRLTHGENARDTIIER